MNLSPAWSFLIGVVDLHRVRKAEVDSMSFARDIFLTHFIAGVVTIPVMADILPPDTLTEI